METWLLSLAGFAVGVLAFALMAVIEYGAWALVSPPRGLRAALTEASPEGTPIWATAGDGVRLAGRLVSAPDHHHGRVVLLLHGFAEAESAVQNDRTDALRRSGWNVAVLDSRGYGDSGGLYASFGGREAGDVSIWLDSLAALSAPAQNFVPVIWGRSMGAAIAVRSAAIDRRIQALILESPMIDLNDAMTVWFRNRSSPLPGLLARLVTRRAARLAGVSLTYPNAMETAPRVQCPVLIVHGDADRLVSVQESRRLARAFPSPAQLIEIPGAGHTDVVAVGGAPLLRQIAQFLETLDR